MTITSVAAIDAMVKSRFDAAVLLRITGSPEYNAIDELVEVIAQIANTFKTKRYGGKYGVFPLIVSKDKHFSCAVEPALQNPTIALCTLPDNNKTLHAEYKVA